MYYTHSGYRTSIFGENCAYYIQIFMVVAYLLSGQYWTMTTITDLVMFAVEMKLVLSDCHQPDRIGKTTRSCSPRVYTHLTSRHLAVGRQQPIGITTTQHTGASHSGFTLTQNNNNDDDTYIAQIRKCSKCANAYRRQTLMFSVSS